MEYAIHCQRDRRNLSDADMIRWIAEVDKRKTAQERAAKGNARREKTYPQVRVSLIARRERLRSTQLTLLGLLARKSRRRARYWTRQPTR